MKYWRRRKTCSAVPRLDELGTGRGMPYHLSNLGRSAGAVVAVEMPLAEQRRRVGGCRQVFGLTISEVDATLRPQFAATGSRLNNAAVDVDCLRFLREHRNLFR